MADLAQVEAALIKADAAGDADGARILAAEVRKMRSGQAQGTQTEGWKPFTPSGSRTGGVANITTAEAILGHPVTQFAVGAAEPILGGLQAAGVPIDANAIKEMSDRGAELYGGSYTQVPARLAGNILSPVFLGAAKALPVARTAGQAIKTGAILGGTAGLTSLLPNDAPVEQRAINTAAGTALGAAIPAGIEGVKSVAGGLSHVADLFRGETGAGNILDRYVKNAIGEKNVPAVVSRLRTTGGEPLPGYKPTVAEVVAGLPEGSPLIAHQRITASTKGGPSADFGRRILDQKAAIAAAAEARDNTVVPLLKQSLQTANQTGIKSGDVVSKIDDALQKPGFRASDVVNKSLEAVKEKINKLSTNGIIDGEDLWTVRKEIGNTIKTFSKETANWDKRLTGKLEGQLQKAIDEAIVKAGAQDWPQHMAAYAARSQAIQRVKDSAKAAIRPDQRTDLFGGLRVAEETRTHVPQLLSRPMMAANAIMRYFSANIEPKIDKLAAQRYLNPKDFADALEKLPPQTQSQIIETMKRIGIATAVQQAVKDDVAESVPSQPIPAPPAQQKKGTLSGIKSTLPPASGVPVVPQTPTSFVRG